jgi:hypothetical protein
MPSADLDTTNLWLALIAITSIVQLLIVIALLVGALRFYRRMEKTVEEITEKHIAPVSARAHEVIDEIEDVMVRVRTFDDDVRRTLSRVGDGVGIATSAVRTKFWPVVGLLRGLKVGLSTLARSSGRSASQGRSASKPPVRAKVTKLSPKDASDVEAEQRFAYEGGASHARG